MQIDHTGADTVSSSQRNAIKNLSRKTVNGRERTCIRILSAIVAGIGGNVFFFFFFFFPKESFDEISSRSLTDIGTRDFVPLLMIRDNNNNNIDLRSMRIESGGGARAVYFPAGK